ncbi:hypothetical protein BKA81DRAFT_226214 [Phyllosticta paracitricarpa]
MSADRQTDRTERCAVPHADVHAWKLSKGGNEARVKTERQADPTRGRHRPGVSLRACEALVRRASAAAGRYLTPCARDGLEQPAKVVVMMMLEDALLVASLADGRKVMHHSFPPTQTPFVRYLSVSRETFSRCFANAMFLRILSSSPSPFFVDPWMRGETNWELSAYDDAGSFFLRSCFSAKTSWMNVALSGGTCTTLVDSAAAELACPSLLLNT